MANKPIFITGIGTGVGKTLVAAIVTEALKADYWKPIQSGDLDNSDTMKVKSLVSNTETVFHAEAYRLTQPYSPHKSAALDNIRIDERAIVLPKTDNLLVIEGAGGVMVPLNENFLMVDLISQLDVSVILVSQNYLGSINHTLLSIDSMVQRGIFIMGIIFNGEENRSSEEYIINYTGIPFLGRIPVLTDFSHGAIIEAGEHLDL